MKKRFITHPLRNTGALITLPRHTCVHTVKGSAVTQLLCNRMPVWVLGSRSAKTNTLSPSRSSGRTLFPVCMMVRSHTHTIKDFNKSGFASESNSQQFLLEGAHRQKHQPPVTHSKDWLQTGASIEHAAREVALLSVFSITRPVYTQLKIVV